MQAVSSQSQHVVGEVHELQSALLLPPHPVLAQVQQVGSPSHAPWPKPVHLVMVPVQRYPGFAHSATSHTHHPVLLALS